MRTRHSAGVAGVFAVGVMLACGASAREVDPRIGKWENENNPNNVMTYAAVSGGGMSVLVENVERGTSWGYSSMLDGTFSPMTGSTNRDEAAVTVIDEYVNEIVYRTDGEVSSVLTNVISEDGQTLTVTFRSQEGEEQAVAIYRKIEE